ncbi:MAG: hypothetical protein EBS55_09145 [Flavobacteriaceae bacterium]|nr:hypothetical protein [Flavobacteriaceae bacterium]
MIGTEFRAISGIDDRWFVFKSHGIFSNVWACYPVEKFMKNGQIKESFVQHFSTDFIKQNEIINKTTNYDTYLYRS